MYRNATSKRGQQTYPQRTMGGIQIPDRQGTQGERQLRGRKRHSMTPTEKTAEKLSALANSSLFKQVPEQELTRLVHYAKVQEMPAKAVVFHKGDPGAQMFLLIEGRAKTTTLSEDGKEIVFDILDAGQVFGEISLIDGHERTATITTMERCRFLVLERRDFIPFLERHPKVAIHLLTTISGRLRATDEMLEDALFRNLPARLAKKLLNLVESYGREQGNGSFLIDLKLSQQELGQLVGTSRESVNKQIRFWERAGVLSVQQRFITVHKLQELAHIARSAE